MITKYRDALPEDVNVAVPLIYSSGPPSFEFVFKISEQKDATAFLNYIFLKPGTEFSFTNHICLLNEENEVIGIGSHFGAESTGSFTRLAIKYIFSFYGLLNGILVLRRGLQVEKIIPPPKGNTEVLAHIAILSSYQSKGLGSNLLEHLIQKAKQKGKSTVSLDVSHENPRAKALYERTGFDVIKRTRSTLKNKFSYVADHYKMFKDI